MDDQRVVLDRFLLIAGLSFCLALIGGVGYTIYSTYRYRNEPPKLTQFVPVPVKVGDKTVMVGIGVAEWQVPEELNAALIEVERQNQLAAQKEKENALKAGSNAPSQETNKQSR